MKITLSCSPAMLGPSGRSEGTPWGRRSGAERSAFGPYQRNTSILVFWVCGVFFQPCHGSEAGSALSHSSLRSSASLLNLYPCLLHLHLACTLCANMSAGTDKQQTVNKPICSVIKQLVPID